MPDLDEQRHVVDHDGVGVGVLLQPAEHLDADGGVHDRLEVLAGRLVVEDDGGDRRPVERAVGGDDAGSEALDHGVEHRLARAAAARG